MEPRVKASLLETYEILARTDGLLDPARLAGYQSLFRSQFGPEVLRSLDGEALLSTMHAHGVKDSLVVWLEYKDDDEFRGGELGGIGGGAAHKFNLFKRADTSQWVTGSPQNARDISQTEAIEVARRHRDQLLAAVAVLAALQPSPGDAPAAYLRLQRDLAAQAPDLYNKGWAHKYLSLLFPDRIDDYHNTDWQNHHLIRLLIAPSEEKEGLYVNAYHDVRLAAEFGWPMNHLTRVLNVRSGPPVKYWRIGTTLGDDGSIWDDMHRDGYVAVGWEAIGDLSGPVEDAARREQTTPLIEAIKPRLAEHYGQWMPPGVITRKAGEIARFGVGIASGDLVLAVQGFGALGVGRVTGPVSVRSRCRAGRCAAPSRGGVARHRTVRVALAGGRKVNDRQAAFLVGQPDRDRAPATRRQACPRPSRTRIFHGDTGGCQGKRRSIIAAQAAVKEKSRTRPSRFGTQRTGHPLRATRHGQNVLGQPQRAGHRGDIPRIFGELLTLLEMDKRARFHLQLPLSGDWFTVPPNVWIIGTMNTADRLIALLDAALRRRFGFVELMPDPDMFGSAQVADSLPLGPWLRALNRRVREHVGRDARNLQIGHAYLLEGSTPITELTRFTQVLADDIFPFAGGILLRGLFRFGAHPRSGAG